MNAVTVSVSNITLLLLEPISIFRAPQVSACFPNNKSLISVKSSTSRRRIRRNPMRLVPLTRSSSSSSSPTIETVEGQALPESESESVTRRLILLRHAMSSWEDTSLRGINFHYLFPLFFRIMGGYHYHYNKQILCVIKLGLLSWTSLLM